MTKLTADDYERLIKHARHVARDTGIDETFRKYNINVIVGPIESSLSLFAAAAGQFADISICVKLNSTRRLTIR